MKILSTMHKNNKKCHIPNTKAKTIKCLKEHIAQNDHGLSKEFSEKPLETWSLKKIMIIWTLSKFKLFALQKTPWEWNNKLQIGEQLL